MLTQTSPERAVSVSPVTLPQAAKQLKVAHFICWMQDGWYVEGEDGETGPFDDLREAETYCFGLQKN